MAVPTTSGQPDINNLDLLAEPVDVGDESSAEKFFAAPMVDDGEHTVVLKLGDRGIKVDRQRDAATKNKTGPAYLNVHLVAKVLNDDGTEGLTLFDNPTSIKFESVGTSKLVAILAATGNPATGIANLGDLKAFTERVLAQGPRCRVVSQWQARVENKDGTWRDVLKGQARFPLKENGKHDPEVVDAKTGQTVRARAEIVRYLKA